MGITKSQYRKVAEFPAYVKDLTLKADTDEDLVDIAGTIRGVETALAGVRTDIASEVPAGTSGNLYRMMQGKRSQFSYNTPLLLKTISEALDLSLTKTLGYLLHRNVITIGWRFKALESLLDEKNISVTIARHDVTEGDPEHIGRWQKPSYPSYEPMNVG